MFWKNVPVLLNTQKLLQQLKAVSIDRKKHDEYYNNDNDNNNNMIINI